MYKLIRGDEDMLSYNTLNWENFKYKNSQNLNKAFEALSYYLFCYEFDKKYGIHRYFNQAGIETDPIIQNDISSILYFMAKDGRIKRTKQGKTYLIEYKG